MDRSLKVILWGQELGRLVWDNRRKLSYFLFNPAMIGGSLDVAPIVAPVSSPTSRLPHYGEEARMYQKLPSFLADSLPDEWGDQLFELWRSENRIPNADITPLEKLAFIGKRGMGALEFEPQLARSAIDGKIDLGSLAELAQRVFLQRENVCIQPGDELTVQSLIAVGTSAGGRQPKAIVAINRNTGEIRSGQVAGLKDYDYCIIKFGDEGRSSAQIEMCYYEMARRAGIDMMESRLIDVGGKKHFLTRRFDRDGNAKLHTQTLAALYPGAESYERLVWVCRRLRLAESAVAEVFRRLVFNVLGGNTDDHSKNFSFIMDRSGVWTLAPAYDVTFIFNHGGYQPQEERCLMVHGKLSYITKDDVLAFASECGIRRAEAVIEEVASALMSFRQLAAKHGVKDEWAGRVWDSLKTNLTGWGFFPQQASASYISPSGTSVSGIIVSQDYKGNYRLSANVGGTFRRHIIRRGSEDYETIARTGIANLSHDVLCNMAEKHLISRK